MNTKDCRLHKLTAGPNIALIILILICIFYYILIGDVRYYDSSSMWQNPANIHDHMIYSNYESYPGNRGFRISDNNYGMYYIYQLFPEPQIQFVSFLVNISFMTLSSILYFKICSIFKLPNRSYYTFFLNSSFIYFSLLVNKDSISIFLFLLGTYLAIRKRYSLLLLAAVPSFLVRQQFVFFFLAVFISTIFNSKGKKANRIPIIIVICCMILISSAIIGATLLSYFKFVSIDTLGSGLTGRMMDLFIQYPFFSPLGIPIRIGLYVYDMMANFIFISDKGVDIARMLRIPATIYIIYNIKYVFYAIREKHIFRDERFSAMTICLFGAVGSMLINPQVNGRYLVVIYPIILLYLTILRYKNLFGQLADSPLRHA